MLSYKKDAPNAEAFGVRGSLKKEIHAGKIFNQKESKRSQWKASE